MKDRENQCTELGLCGVPHGWLGNGKKIKKETTDLTGTDIMSIIIIISLIIHILSFKKWFDNCAKYEISTDKIQDLEKLTINKI